MFGFVVDSNVLVPSHAIRLAARSPVALILNTVGLGGEPAWQGSKAEQIQEHGATEPRSGPKKDGVQSVL